MILSLHFKFWFSEYFSFTFRITIEFIFCLFQRNFYIFPFINFRIFNSTLSILVLRIHFNTFRIKYLLFRLYFVYFRKKSFFSFHFRIFNSILEINLFQFVEFFFQHVKHKGGMSYRRNETYNYATNKSTPINITWSDTDDGYFFQDGS